MGERTEVTRGPVQYSITPTLKNDNTVSIQSINVMRQQESLLQLNSKLRNMQNELQQSYQVINYQKLQHEKVMSQKNDQIALQ